MSDYEDGAFYWVLWRWATGIEDWPPLRWRGASYLPDWPGGWDHGFGHVFRADRTQDPSYGGAVEIGPCIGKEPSVNIASPDCTFLVSIAEPPATGTAEVIRGSIRYTPATGRVGKDGFTYTVG